MTRNISLKVFVFISCLSAFTIHAESNGGKEGKPSWKKKDIRDYTDADLERLYDQWEDNDDEPLEEDELPPYKKPPPKIDMSKLDTSNPDAMISATKKGQSLMMFVSVSGNPSREEADGITKLWQTSLYNAHYDIQRYMIEDDRAIFMLTDGAKAPEVRDFLVRQERCKDVTIEGQVYPGAAQGEADHKKSRAKKNKKPKKKSEL